MKILQLHNRYIYQGGEDAVVHSEAAMLRSFGHDVAVYERSNQELDNRHPWTKICFYGRDIYFSEKVYEEVSGLIKKTSPDIAHIHNSFLMLGPAAYQACFDAGIPVVQTLHNYRFLCPAGTCFRAGRICEECLVSGRSRSVIHGCWHGRIGSWLMQNLLRVYEQRGILERISKFIVLSEFSRRKFIQAGWDGARLVVKPNFLDKDPGIRQASGEYVLYAGTLQDYKGVDVLLKAWREAAPSVPLKIAGTGPLEVALKAHKVQGVEWLGQRSLDEVADLIRGAVCVVVPSLCYENFPRVIIEAFAAGVPVVASRLGSMEELVKDGETGLLFVPGDPHDLSAKLQYCFSHSVEVRRLGENARRVFERSYTAKENHRLLQQIYEQAMKRIV